MFGFLANLVCFNHQMMNKIYLCLLYDLNWPLCVSSHNVFRSTSFEIHFSTIHHTNDAPGCEFVFADTFPI